MGAGTSLKHYAANNQETRRMTINTVADMRALREIYLKSFEIPVKKAKPWTVMCSYNKIDGVFSSDNKWLLTDLLRDEWGYEGLVVTDWGAMNDPVQAVLAGLDLEMPGGNEINAKKIVAAVNEGKLNESDVDKAAARVVEMALRGQEGAKKGFRYNIEGHHQLVRKAAAESCVLLKNEDNILPLKENAKLAVIGGFAKNARYQGAGSSKINPTKIDSAYEELKKLGFDVTYAEGYHGVTADDALVAEAVETAKKAEYAVIFAGLPDEFESEGFDRKTLDMPESHTRLIREVAGANPNTVIVLQLGAPVATGWKDSAKGLLVSYLGGQASAGGAADVLAGKVNPGGKLPESWPLKLSDNPSYNYFPGGARTVEYRESLFVGYRYYDTAGVPVAFPFGYGLSYTNFKYADLEIKNDEISFSITNTGPVPGAEAAQVYLGMPGTKIIRPKKWLAAFEKVRLAPGETKKLNVKLDKDAFRYFNVPANGWRTEGGAYGVLVGASSTDIRLTGTVETEGDGDEKLLAAQNATGYANVSGNTFSDKDFTALYGRPLPPADRLPDEPYTVNDTLRDIRHTTIGKKIIETATKQASEAFGVGGEDVGRMVDAMLLDMPIRAIGSMGGGMVPPDFAELLVGTLNGNFFKRMAATVKLLSAMAKVQKK
jgi:beta-glucosidase